MGDPFPRRAEIDESLVRDLLEEQFPQWADLPVIPVPEAGNDHRTFRLGDALVVRMPADTAFVPQVQKEQEWLPRLAPQVPLPIPRVAGRGRAGERFPAPWSVYEWIDGRPPDPTRLSGDDTLAADLASFLLELRRADATSGPAPGMHSAYRGGPVAQWDDQVRRRLSLLDPRQRDRAVAVWRDATSATAEGPPVWVHGDVAIGNLLVDGQGILSAVIDFGCAAVGDPACDTVMYWTRFRGAAQRAFRRELALDEATWARGAGWALWKGLIMLTNTTPGEADFARRVLDELLEQRLLP